jgi:hypothetical protein
MNNPFGKIKAAVSAIIGGLVTLSVAGLANARPLDATLYGINIPNRVAETPPTPKEVLPRFFLLLIAAIVAFVVVLVFGLISYLKQRRSKK